MNGETESKNEAIVSASAGLLVVFPCLNEETYLERLVTSFVASLDGQDAHFVIVDGGSTDQSPQIAQRLSQKYAQVSFLSNPHRLQSSAVNLAVRQFGEGKEFLVRVDVHADYPADYCQRLVEEANRNGADSVVVAMVAEGRGWFQKAVAIAQNSILGNGGSVHRRTGVGGHWVDHGHHALMRLEPFRAVHGYDETFSHNEDAELDWRLCAAGYKIWLTDATCVRYFPRSRPFGLLKQYFSYGCGRARNIMKNGIRPKIRQLLPAIVLPACLSVFLFPVTALALVPVLVWAGLCVAFGLWLGRDEKLHIALAVGVAAMIMHLGWSTGFLRCLICRKGNCS
ncbi:MAG TPA: succinoglycan biosynthesis protein exoa [Rhodospirillaceae bacterium]|nr:succinoglycan biosynthesis protein exoa [Rhodospirillaceae bacterium]